MQTQQWVVLAILEAKYNMKWEIEFASRILYCNTCNECTHPLQCKVMTQQLVSFGSKFWKYQLKIVSSLFACLHILNDLFMTSLSILQKEPNLLKSSFDWRHIVEQ